MLKKTLTLKTFWIGILLYFHYLLYVVLFIKYKVSFFDKWCKAFEVLPLGSMLGRLHIASFHEFYHLFLKIERLRLFRLSRTKFIAAWVRNNDIFSPSREAARVENKSLFLTKAVMNFVRERRNGRKRYSHDFEYQKL